MLRRVQVLDTGAPCRESERGWVDLPSALDLPATSRAVLEWQNLCCLRWSPSRLPCDIRGCGGWRPSDIFKHYVCGGHSISCKSERNRSVGCAAFPHGIGRMNCSVRMWRLDRKSTRLNSSHLVISYAVFCLKKKKQYSTGFIWGCTPSACVGTYTMHRSS